MTKTVIEYVHSRLEDIGITHVFGVAGDFAFPIDNAITQRSTLKWIGSSNELNATCAADGYARVQAEISIGTTCCGTGDDRGLLHPQFARSPTRDPFVLITTQTTERYISAKRTCEHRHAPSDR